MNVRLGLRRYVWRNPWATDRCMPPCISLSVCVSVRARGRTDVWTRHGSVDVCVRMCAFVYKTHLLGWMRMQKRGPSGERSDKIWDHEANGTSETTEFKEEFMGEFLLFLLTISDWLLLLASWTELTTGRVCRQTRRHHEPT